MCDCKVFCILFVISIENIQKTLRFIRFWISHATYYQLCWNFSILVNFPSKTHHHWYIFFNLKVYLIIIHATLTLLLDTALRTSHQLFIIMIYFLNVNNIISVYYPYNKNYGKIRLRTFKSFLFLLLFGTYFIFKLHFKITTMGEQIKFIIN